MTSCLKKTECSGHVYSKSNVPVSRINITLLERKLSTREDNISVVATTDNNGYYKFSIRTKRNRAYSITTEDINSVPKQLNPSNVNNIDIYLTK
jgi:hypothetical protein